MMLDMGAKWEKGYMGGVANSRVSVKLSGTGSFKACMSRFQGIVLGDFWLWVNQDI
jgi:hypothetical protein